MAYARINVLAELRKLAKDKPTKTPACIIADWAFPLVLAGLRERDVDELERLYSLEDPRPPE
jgi:hypothetical protein